MFKKNNQQKQNPHVQKTPWQLAQEAQQVKQTQPISKNSKKQVTKTTKKWAPKADITTVKRRMIIIFFILLMWAIYFISPLAKVKEYQFVGTMQVDPLEIIMNGGLDNNQTVWSILAKEDKINESVVERVPKVKAVEVSLDLPNTIVVTVLENPAIAHYMFEDKHYELLANGKSLEVPADNMDLPYPLLVGFSNEDLEKIAQQLSKVPIDIIANMKRIELVNAPGIKNRLLIQMHDGTPVIGNLDTIGSKIGYYPRIKQEVGNRKGTIDMEVGVFFTPE